jgi:hypothetical protein
MKIERTHGYTDADGLLVHHLVAYDDSGDLLVALPRFPLRPTQWWNGTVNQSEVDEIHAAIKRKDGAKG